MRRLVLAGVVLALAPVLAYAGRTVTDGTDTLRIKAAVKPAKASKSLRQGRAVEFSFDYVAGTTDGSRVADVRSASVYGGGGVTNYDAFRRCSEITLRDKGPGACPRGSRVGRGTATIELHLTEEKQDVSVPIRVFNGRVQIDRNGRRYDKPRDGIIFFTRFEGGKQVIAFEARDRNRRVTYSNPKKDPEPPGDNALYTVKEVHVTFVRKTRRGVPWMQAPAKCRRKWVVTATTDRYDGGPITAKHAIRCRQA